MTIAVQDEVVNRAAEAQRLRHLQVERAQYEADLAQRRYADQWIRTIAWSRWS